MSLFQGNWICSIVLSVLSFICISSVQSTEPSFTLPHRGCYYASWSTYRPGKARFLPRHIDASLCTIIYYAFADIKLEVPSDPASGQKSPAAFGSITKAGGSPYSGVSISLSDSVTEIRYVKRQYPNTKLILSIGGWGAVDAFNSVAASSDLRKLFVSSAVSTVRKLRYDGLDISWEYPAKKDNTAATALFSELKGAIDAEAKNSGLPRLILTAAVTNTSIEGYNIPEMAKMLDLFNLMTYDLHNPEFQPSETGHHCQLYPPTVKPSSKNVKDFVEAWEKAGVPKSKLLVGLAAYGDTWNLTVSNKFGLEAPAQGKGPPGFYTRTSGMLSYYEICEKIRSGELLPTLQPDIKTPYAHAVSGKWWISYDDESSVREKVRWTQGKGYGGVFLWDISLDDFFGSCGVRYPLLNAIKLEYKA